jgi:K+-transporting ATPase ATPase A chain
VSFVTNTNWQDYSPEQTVSYLTQMLGFTVQNFLSAATGIVVVIALIRGFARHTAKTIGNFWVDVTRVTLYVLVPMSALIAALLMSQGMIQNFRAYEDVPVLQTTTYAAPKLDAAGNPVKDAKGNPVTVDTKVASQTLAMGPVASQVAIKMLGTNGGGFFNANSAHPFENPTALANLVQMLCIFALGAAVTNVFGRMIGDERQGWAIFAAMMLLFVLGAVVAYWSEAHANPAFAPLGVDPSMGNMEGKETRFGIIGSALFATVTTDASCGAVNAMHESFLPLGGMVPLVNMMLGEIIFGGVGSGLYGFLLFAIVAVFVAGLMVGRTPEYLGKKIEAREIKLTMLAILCLPLVMLGFTALAVVLPQGLAALSAAGPHGFTEALYAYTSAAANNGSAFSGLSANTFWNVTLGIGMMIGRFFVIVPVLAIAGSLAAKKTVPASAGTFPTHGGLFVGLVTGVIVVVGGLTFFPALALGPIVEHLAMLRHTLY